MTCNAPTSAHQLGPARLYYHPVTSPRLIRWLCDGCVTRLQETGMDWRLDRRSDPARPDRGRSLNAIREAYERLPAALSDRTPRESGDRVTPFASDRRSLRAPSPVPPGLRVRPGGLGALIHRPGARTLG